MSTLSDVRSLCFADRKVMHIYYGDPTELPLLPSILDCHESKLVVGAEKILSQSRSKISSGLQPVLSLIYDVAYTRDVTPEYLLHYLMSSISSKPVKSELQCWYMRQEELRKVFDGFLLKMDGRRRVMKPLPTGVECIFEAKKGERLAMATFSEVPLPEAP